MIALRPRCVGGRGKNHLCVACAQTRGRNYKEVESRPVGGGHYMIHNLSPCPIPSLLCVNAGGITTQNGVIYATVSGVY